MAIVAAICHLAGEAMSPQNSFLKGVPEAHLREVRHSGHIAGEWQRQDLKQGRTPGPSLWRCLALACSSVSTHLRVKVQQTILLGGRGSFLCPRLL